MSTRDSLVEELMTAMQAHRVTQQQLRAIEDRNRTEQSRIADLKKELRAITHAREYGVLLSMILRRLTP